MAPREVYRRVRTDEGDERKPQCRHCEVGHRDCEYEFLDNSSHHEDGNRLFHFSADHVWLKTPPEIRFVHSVDVCNGDDDEHNATVPSPSQSFNSGIAQSPLTQSSNEPQNMPLAHLGRDDAVSILSSKLSRDAAGLASPHSVTSVASMETTILRRTSGSAIYTQGPTKPLEDPLIARLLRHYINNLACWLDVNDSQRQFETFVPYLAMSCPILLFAVLAFSACHLNRVDGSCDELCAVHYHDLSVQGLIPALADSSTTLDNVLPISTVILRMYEMMSHETDYQRHLRGCSSLFTHNRKNIGYRALKRTAFWTYFREEIMVALATGKPTATRPRNWKVDITWGGDTDHIQTPTMRAAGMSCKPKQTHGKTRCQMSDTIRLSVLSVIMLTLPVVAMQFYHLVKVLLALHNPHRPNGIGFLQFARNIEGEILQHTIQLCGMTKALGDRYAGALVNAVQPLVVCYDVIDDPRRPITTGSLECTCTAMI
ncbi:uncharacterized protein TRIREDRAFT_104071 [Trichoderma reesei QM6a]|uniref:Predicted protein n=1 Tax=Hypocrea jecorina (strain QM6a) TaxID=431241 RepID=G0RB80_HYPJQ|nr:uncharacterized protein TRIREDRAFT_104071 [Trichoderma reesei QM6a]EGR51027.1 predicted protein [Trichoderma reesei QM6a]